MADDFVQVIKDVREDAVSFSEFMFKPKDFIVERRLEPSINTLAYYIDEATGKIFQNGGLPATPFATKALMTASALIDGSYAQVTDGTTDNGLYLKKSGVWVKSNYDPVSLSKEYTDSYVSTNAVAQTVTLSAGDYASIDDIVKTGTYAVTSLTIARSIAGLPEQTGCLIEVIGYRSFIKQTVTPHNSDYFYERISSFTGELVQPFKRFAAIDSVTMNDSVNSIALTSASAAIDTKFESLGENKPLVSSKNLYGGAVKPFTRVNDTGILNSANKDDIHSPFTPVEFGKTYTISGLDNSKVGINSRFFGTAINSPPILTEFKVLTSSSDNTVTITIDDPMIKYLSFPLSRISTGTLADVQFLPIQIEEGSVATAYEPHEFTASTMRLSKKMGEGDSPVEPTPTNNTVDIISEFTELNRVRDPNYTTLETIEKSVSGIGLFYSVESTNDSAANNLYASYKSEKVASKSVNVHLRKQVGDVKTEGVLKPTSFNTPSGILDNPDSFSLVDKYPKSLPVHPSIAYSDTAIAGFKYWMVCSAFPPTAETGALWEDEDLFVSNDAKNWQRVRSMYETTKDYTTTTLRLPPQAIVSTGARKNAFLPSPIVGSVFEVSVPATKNQLAVERQQYTVSSTLPWKHDPFLLIEGGYVYVYHSFNIFFNERNDEKSHFFVCVRTNDGVNWDFVRSDGSTLRITEETSKQIFTKGADGKYNYLNYAYDDSRSNPEIVKFAEGDYELFYGRNFTERYHGTTPYNFSFSSPETVKDLGNMNHPTLILQDDVLYNLSNYWVNSSTDRGTTWTKLPHYPMWRGGVDAFNYRKSCCVGEGGTFIVTDVQRVYAPSYELNHRSVTNNINTMFIYQYNSFADFLSKANTGLVDAYIDLLIVKVNTTTQTRDVINLPALSMTNADLTGSRLSQRIKVADLDLKVGDTVHFYVTLNSRNGASIMFGGIDLV